MLPPPTFVQVTHFQLTPPLHITAESVSLIRKEDTGGRADITVAEQVRQ